MKKEPSEKTVNVQEEEVKAPLLAVFNVITVTLSFPDYPQWIFKFARQLSKDLKEAQQLFFGLEEEEQKEKVVAHRIEQLSQLLTERPENVPGISDVEDFRAAFIEFFTENSQIMGWLWGQYQGKLYPKEILLSPSD